MTRIPADIVLSESLQKKISENTASPGYGLEFRSLRQPLADGRLLYRFKRPWRDGTTHVVFEGLELLERLSALVPAPRTHLVRYSGILAPAARWRAQIVPAEAATEPAPMPEAACAPETAVIIESVVPSEAVAPVGSVEAEPRTVPHPRNYTWAELMKRVWAFDVLECPRWFCQLTVRRSKSYRIGRRRSGNGDPFPSRKRTCPQQAVMNRFESVPSQPKEIQKDAMHRKEELSLSWRLELPHLPLPLSGRLV